MQLAQHFAGATMLKLDFDPDLNQGPVNATAYAAKEVSGAMLLAVINKDAASSLTLRLQNTWKRSLDFGFRQIHALSAASLTSTTVFETPIAQPAGELLVPSGTAIVFRQDKA